MSVSFCLPHHVAVSAFMMCRGLCACTEMCVLYVSVGSKVRHRTFGCVAKGSALLCIFRSRLLVYSAGSGVNRVQVVLSGFSMRCCSAEQRSETGRYEDHWEVSLPGFGIGIGVPSEMWCHPRLRISSSG